MCSRVTDGATVIEAAHTNVLGPRGLGQKTSDFSAIPLCAGHHRENLDSYHLLGENGFSHKHGIDLKEFVLRLQSRFWQQDVSASRAVCPVELEISGMGAEEMELWQTGNINMPGETPILLPPSAADPILDEVVRRLQELYCPEQIYLFGSTARGESGPDSDYDLMVVVPDSTPVALRDSGRAYKAIWRLGVATDVLVWTHSDFVERLQLKSSLPSTIAREGKLLYAA